MKDQTIEKMAPETKEWFAKAVVGMILADGRIDKAEINYLNNLLGFLSDPVLVESMSDLLKKNEIPTLEPLEIVTNEGLEILKHLTVMAVIDENLANREVKYLKEVAEKLGLSDEVADRFLSLAKEKLRRAKYSAKLASEDHSEQVRCFDLTENSCMFYSFRAVKPKTTVTLQLYYESPTESGEMVHQPVVAESTWCRPVRSKYGNFVVRAIFKDELAESQGLELIKYIHHEEGSA